MGTEAVEYDFMSRSTKHSFDKARGSGDMFASGRTAAEEAFYNEQDPGRRIMHENLAKAREEVTK